MTESLLHPADAPPSIYGPDGRPQFFGDPAMDRFAPVVLNLALELWVQTEHLENLKGLLGAKGLVTEDELNEIARTGASDAGREDALRDFIHRTLAPLRESTP